MDSLKSNVSQLQNFSGIESPNLQKNLISSLPERKYQSFIKLFLITIILAIGPMIFGYAQSEISTIPVKQLPQVFSFPANQLPLIDGLLVGIMPIGGMVGGPMYAIILMYFTRKNTHYLVAVINIISLIFLQIPILPTLMIGRFLLGICAGVYTAVSAIYIRQIAPTQIKGVLLSMFGLFKILGVVVCYGLGLALQSSGWYGYWRIVFAVPAILSVVQCITLFLVIPDSPIELLEKQKFEQCKIALRKIYKQQYVEQVFGQFVVQIQEDQARKENMEKIKIIGQDGQKDYSINKIRALIFCIYIAILRQFVGGTTMVSYSGQIIGLFNPTLGKYGSLMVNGVQLLATIPNLFFVSYRLGRRMLFHLGVSLCALAMLGAAIANNVNAHRPSETAQILTVIFMILFGLFNGLFASPVFWYYTAQIVPPSKQPLVTFFSWGAIAIVSIFPPIITSHLPVGQAFPLFYFFFACGFIGVIVNYFFLVETKNKTYEQIVSQY